MPLLNLVNAGMAAAEAGRLPDAAVRLGIRRLLGQRIAELKQRDVAGQQEWIQEFVETCRSSAIAEVPDMANEQHYEVPAAFYQNALGPHLKYSSCFWNDMTTTLAAAEADALRLTCEHACLQDGMRVLELGCGWGSLSLWMAEHFPSAEIVSVSNSTSQRQFILQRAAERGLSNLQVLTADMNDFSTNDKFDRVVSVEMFEHMRNHAELMRRVSTWLKPHGKLFVHIFCHASLPYLYEDKGPSDWMTRHFFAGGMMPSDHLLLHYQTDLQLVRQWRWNGKHYAKTCRAWLANADSHREAILAQFRLTYGSSAQLWFQRWRIFFMACEELFAWRGGDEWYVSHYLFDGRKP